MIGDEEMDPIERACRDSAHQNRGRRLGETCLPCAEDELQRLRKIVERLSSSALRIIKRPDGHWLYIEAGGLEGLILLRGPELNPFSLVDRAIAAAACVEILPGSMQFRPRSVPEVVEPPALSGCPSCEAGNHGSKCVNAMCDCPCRQEPEILREHIVNGPCWCKPVEEDAVSKHKT